MNLLNMMKETTETFMRGFNAGEKAGHERGYKEGYEACRKDMLAMVDSHVDSMNKKLDEAKNILEGAA